MTRTQEEAARAVAAVLDGARELAERHGVVLAIGAGAFFGAGRLEVAVASSGPPERALDIAATATGALLGVPQGPPKPKALQSSIDWGLRHSAELVRTKRGRVA